MQNIPTRLSHPAQRPRRAFTLIELVIGSAITALVMLAVGSTLTLMTRGAASVENASHLTLDATLAMARLRREIGGACTIAELTATHIRFTHPDLDTVAYDWSASDKTLSRTAGTGSAMPILNNVTEFVLTSHTEQQTVAGANVTQSPEGVLASHEACPYGYICNHDDALVTSTTWLGEQFSVNCPPGTQSFSITRATLYLKGNTGTGRLGVSIQDLAAKTTFEENTGLSADTLPASDYAPYEFVFSGVTGLQNGQNYTVVVRTNAASTRAYLKRDTYGLFAPVDGTVYKSSGDSGAHWNTDPRADLRFVIYGRYKYTVPQAGATETHTYLTHLDIRIKLVEGTRTATLDSGTMCLNRPEITASN